MADDLDQKPKKSGLKTALKWIFKLAVIGIGFGIGSELITEFLFAGVMHGSTPLSHMLMDWSIQFTDPIMAWINNAAGGEQGLAWFKGLLKGTHEMMGIHGTFEPPMLADLGADAANAVSETVPDLVVPGL